MKTILNNIELIILKISLITLISTLLYMITKYGVVQYISFNGI